jgi:hypothetical protein
MYLSNDMEFEFAMLYEKKSAVMFKKKNIFTAWWIIY